MRSLSPRRQPHERQDARAQAQLRGGGLRRGFEAEFGTKFNVFQKGLITAIPYLPAAVALYFWSRDASRRGVKTWHIAAPALLGALSVPLALYMQSPTATVLAITVTACSIFAALPNFWAAPVRKRAGTAQKLGSAAKIEQAVTVMASTVAVGDCM